MGDIGLEETQDSPEKAAKTQARAAESGAISDDGGLSRVIEAWPGLTAEARRAILQIVSGQI